MKIYIVSEIDDPFSDDDGTLGHTEKIVAAYFSEEKAKSAAESITNGLRYIGEYRGIDIEDAMDFAKEMTDALYDNYIINRRKSCISLLKIIKRL